MPAPAESAIGWLKVTVTVWVGLAYWVLLSGVTAATAGLIVVKLQV